MARRGALRRFARGAAAALGAAALAGCVPYPVYTAPPPSKYDRVWDAAYGAAQDAGVRITTADRGGGLIQGTRDGVDVTIRVRGQPDGGAVAEIKTAAPGGQDGGLAGRISQAYDRRMGR
jgi:hypothetical protein